MEPKTEPVSAVETDENPFTAKFEGFFEGPLKKGVERLLNKWPEKKSLEIDFRELERFDPDLADSLLDEPDYLLDAAQSALQGIEKPILDQEKFTPKVRFYSLPKERQPLLREIGSAHLGKLVSVEGVVRQITDVLPKLNVAVWECRRCGKVYREPQRRSAPEMPAMCECRHRDFALQHDKSEFLDYQKLEVQEPLELLRGNEQAVNLDIYMSEDLVNTVTAGDRTRVTGILRLRPPKDKKLVFNRYLEAVHIEETAKEFEEVEISGEEETQIKELAKKQEIYNILIQSIAPAIYGHEIVKEAIVLQLFGGTKKLLPNKQVIRGNVHILLVGDPGMAKSQILMAANNIAPKSIYVAGKTSSGVGLTASAVKDEFGEGGWTLKAGALVLASGGIAMVDEFDKMLPEDRSAMHEAMEQGRVSVAKAGIVTQFKTDTSILAAANPKFSRFDPFSPVMEQVNLPSTLMSRFDLFFMMKDVLDKIKDEAIAEHILKTHKMGQVLSQEKALRKKIGEKGMEEIEKKITPIVSGDLLAKFISFARQKVFPVMSEDAMKKIAEFYIGLREQGKREGSYAATHRQLEGLVRLSEASARVRLSNAVELTDADRAIRVVRASLEDVVIDPETGKIDIDIITSGQTFSQFTQLTKVLKFIKKAQQEQDMIPIEEVREEMKGEGMDKEKVDDVIDKLKKKGELYEPKRGFLKATERK